MTRAVDELSFAEKAIAAYGGEPGLVPDWVAELAAWTDRVKLRGVAGRLGVSTTMISQIINKKYDRDLSRVEALVRGSLMGETVNCPQLGEMTRDVCLGWQAKEDLPSSQQRNLMYRACRSGCPHSRLTGGDDGQS